MTRRSLTELAVFVLLVTLGSCSRVIEWIPPNFQAITAASLFAGFFFRSRLVALCVPLLSMMISDAVIGGYARPVMITVYTCLALPIVWRAYLRTSSNPLRITTAAWTSSLIFFLATNLAAWPTLYSRSLAGLGEAYLRAIPFFGFTLASDLIYSLTLFGVYAFASSLVREPEAAAAPIAPSRVG